MDNTLIKRPGLALGLAALMVAATVGLGILYSAHDPVTARKTQTQSSDTQQPKQRPEFTLPDLNGVSHNIKQWDGKVVAVNFWATWCPPCREEIPLFNELQNRYGPKGMQFVGVAIDDATAVRQYMKSTPIAFPVLVSANDGIEVAQRYGNDVGILPYTAIIGRDGRIAFVQFGAMSKEQAEQFLNSLL